MIYSFEEYELDLQRYELRCAGQPVKIEPQVFNLLAYLIQHRDRLITKEELLEQLWAGRVVGEATLTSRVRAARKAVGDTGRVQRLIQTLHRRGYRFIATIEERPSDTADMREPMPSGHLPSLTAPDGGHIAAMRLPHHLPQDSVEQRTEMALEACADEALPSMLIPSVARRAVGRAVELAQLHSRLQKALGGLGR
jgi:DNA-binding winged helix-turn-helix (wHTH) protein